MAYARAWRARTSLKGGLALLSRITVELEPLIFWAVKPSLVAWAMVPESAVWRMSTLPVWRAATRWPLSAMGSSVSLER